MMAVMLNWRLRDIYRGREGEGGKEDGRGDLSDDVIS